MRHPHLHQIACRFDLDQRTETGHILTHLFTYVSSGLNRENVRLSVGMCLGPDHKPNTLPKPSQSALHVNNLTLLFLTCYVQLSGFQRCPGGGGGVLGVMGMIKWSQKSRPKKIPSASSKT